MPIQRLLKKAFSCSTVLLSLGFMSVNANSATVEEVDNFVLYSKGQLGKHGPNLRTMNAKTDNVMAVYGGYQFITYYDETKTLRLVRRKISDGSSKTIVFTGKKPLFNGRVSNDPHRTSNIAISPNDGKMHIMFGHHNNDLRYLVSKNNNAATVSNANFKADLFGAERNYLVSGRKETGVTYPKIVVGKDDNLLMLRRKGSAPSGFVLLSEYKNGVWSTPKTLATGLIGTWNGSERRNPYTSIAFHDGMLAAFWTWREGVNNAPNHDYNFGYSLDNARTWRNTQDQVVEAPLNIDTPGIKIWDIPQALRPANTVLSLNIDSQKNVHLLGRHKIEEDGRNYIWHYLRRGKEWTRKRLPNQYNSADQLFVDHSTDTLYILTRVQGKVNIVAAEKENGAWDNWETVYQGSRSYFEIAGVKSPDAKRLYVLAQRGSENDSATRAPLDFIEFKLTPDGSATANPPVVTITKPNVSNDSYSVNEGYSSLGILVEASDPDVGSSDGDGIRSVAMKVDGQAVRTESRAPYTFGGESTNATASRELLGLSVGTHTISFTATDTDGESTTVELELTVNGASTPTPNPTPNPTPVPTPQPTATPPSSGNCINVAFRERKELSLANTDCVTFSKNLNGASLAVWDSDVENCNYRGTITSVDGSGSLTVNANYVKSESFSGNTIRFSNDANCKFVKVRAY